MHRVKPKPLLQTGLLLFCLLFPLLVRAQLLENFSDGDFTHAPAWAGDTSSFVVNAQQHLQSNGPAVTGTVLQLTTPSQAVAGTAWEFWASLQLATSSGNYADVYLTADSSDLTSTATRGYFVRLGGTPDEVSLFRKDAGKAAVLLIDGQDKTLGGSHNLVRVRVTRSIRDAWELSIDTTGTGQSYTSQGAATDATYRRSAYFGVLLRYSAANSQKFFFDDFAISDTQPPAPDTLQTDNAQELTVYFNEPLQPEQAEQTGNYTLNGTVHPLRAELTEAGTVRLVFAEAFGSGSNSIQIANLKDLYGNSMASPVERSFRFAPPAVLPGYHELLITEIMADETPAEGLPAQEYIELYNPTDKVLTLQGIRFADATSTMVLPEVQLLPQEYAVVVPHSRVPEFSPYGKVIGISNFPSLNNSGELLQLRQPTGALIFAVKYADTWYKDSRKQDGGWSLEMVDVNNPCAGADNWAASEDGRGGTPAQPNAVAAANPDHTPPILAEATAIAPDELLLTFSESLDSVQAASIARYSLSPSISIKNVQVQGPLFGQVALQLAAPLQESLLYTLTVTGIADCAGNLSTQPLQASFALPSAPEPGDVVINEILFNPRAGGADFVELVNRSAKYLDLQDWQLATVANDSIASRKIISATHAVLAPGAYVVLTSDPANIKSNYPQAREETFLKMTALPAYPDAAGTVVVLQPDGRTADRFSYDETMQFALLDDVNGVSLERLRLEGPSIAGNFHSAATGVMATPGYQNSQAQGDVAAQQVFTVAPLTFSPDGDGYEDFTTVNYTVGNSGLVANITIFDSQGREVRKLARNELLAASGFFQWDGLRADGTKANTGYYVFYIELFGLNGEKSVYKEKVVLGSRL